jgi:hypothetical protein
VPRLLVGFSGLPGFRRIRLTAAVHVEGSDPSDAGDGNLAGLPQGIRRVVER